MYGAATPLRPLVIPCGHSLCESCVSSLPGAHCPLDQQPFVRHLASVNHSLMEALAFIAAHASRLTPHEQPLQSPEAAAADFPCELQCIADSVMHAASDGCGSPRLCVLICFSKW